MVMPWARVAANPWKMSAHLVGHVYQPLGTGLVDEDVRYDAGPHGQGHGDPVGEVPGGEHAGVVPLTPVEPAARGQGDQVTR